MTSTGPLLVIGCGSQARYVIDNLQSAGAEEPVGLVDVEAGHMVNRYINGIQVVCCLEEIPSHFSPEQVNVIVAHGDIQTKLKAESFLSNQGFEFQNAIHERTAVSPSAIIGKGCIINPNVTVMPNAEIGNHVVVHSGAVIEHDNEIGDFVNIAPGVSLAGNVEIGSSTYVYTGASVIPKVKLGTDCVIGAGAVVIEDVPDNKVVAGVPAHVIRDNY